jgi:hypothetical protein
MSTTASTHPTREHAYCTVCSRSVHRAWLAGAWGAWLHDNRHVAFLHPVRRAYNLPITGQVA